MDMQDEWRILGTVPDKQMWTIFYRYHANKKFTILCISGLDGIKPIYSNDVRVIMFDVLIRDIVVQGIEYLKLKTVYGPYRIYTRSEILGAEWINSHRYHRDVAEIIFSFIFEINYFSFAQDVVKGEHSKEDIKIWLNEVYCIDLDSPLIFSEFICSHTNIKVYQLSKRDFVPEKMNEDNIQQFLEDLNCANRIFSGITFFRSHLNRIETIQYVFKQIEGSYAPSWRNNYNNYNGTIVELYGRIFHFDPHERKWQQLVVIK